MPSTTNQVQILIQAVDSGASQVLGKVTDTIGDLSKNATEAADDYDSMATTFGRPVSGAAGCISYIGTLQNSAFSIPGTV